MPMKTHRVKVKQKNAVCMEVTTRNVSAIIDEPKAAGGTNLGLTPIEMLLGSLGSCVAITAFIYGSMKNVPIDDIQVQVEGDINTEGMMNLDSPITTGFQDIRFHFFVKSSAPAEQVRQILELAESKCPVGNTLRNGSKVTLVDATIEA